MEHPEQGGLAAGAGWLGRAVLLAILAVAAAGQAAPPADVPDGLLVARVEFAGVVSISEAYLRRAVQTREGQTFQRAQLEADVRELLRTRKFLNVYANTALEAGQVVVTFVVDEKPAIEGVLLSGNERVKDKDLYPLVPSPGQPLDRYEVDRSREELLRKYREKGYYYATVELDQQALEQERRLVYRITEGPRVRVRKILFEGADAFSPARLQSEVQTKTYVWIFRTGAFNDEQAASDAAALEQFYRREGFLDVRVGYRLEFAGVDRSDLTVVFVVEEGPRYRIDEIEVEGNTTFTTEDLRGRLALQPGEYLRDEVLQADIRRLRDLYGEIGYVDVVVLTAYDFLDEPELVRLRIAIRENKRSRVGRVTVRGNTHTKDNVIRRELRFYPGEDYNTVKARDAERRIRETGLFVAEKVRITPLEDVDGYREALVEVEETDAILFLIGAGVSTDSGLLGSISLENRNFDLFDVPRTFGQFVRGQAFRGAGQRLRLSAEPGTELTRFRIDFFEPYLGDRPLQLGTSAYLWQRDRDAYDERRIGTTFSLGRRFESGPLAGWAVEGALRVEGIKIDDVAALAARDIREAKGSSLLTSAKATIVRDTTDSRFRPSEGYRLTLSWEQAGALGGDHSFGRPSAGIVWYHTVHTDIFDRKSVLALRADTGYIVGDAPMFERYYAGGFGSMRGFAFRGISPRKGIRDDAVGGDFIVLTGGEYSFPLYGKSIRGVTFLDMGTVEEDFTVKSWRAAAGFGIRIDVDLLGPIPIMV